ncbi:MAG TPA: DNRLRE domain-containing protein [Chitinophagaceae bacterium]|nr:DNRLRE domain-containing protein [Chitinophagaceae bacterium]
MKIAFKLLLILFGIAIFSGCSKDPDPLKPPVANAGPSQTIKLPASLTLTGSGTSTNGNIVGYLWSLVSGPNIPAVVSPSSATTAVNNLVAGTYIFQLQVTDNAGLTATDTISVLVNAAVPPIANAGVSQTIQLPTNTVTLTGSGTTTNGSIVGYIWTTVSGPNTPVITSPGSVTTTVNSLVAGSYIFQLQVIDNVGLSATDTMKVIVNPAPQQTLTLQVANNPYEGYIDVLYPNSWFINTEFPIGAWTAQGAPETYRGLMKFDFSTIPAGATIESATLTLYAMPIPQGGNVTDAHFGTANAVYIQRLTSSWTTTVNPFTWNSPPSATNINQVTIPQSTGPYQTDVVDITTLTRDVIANGNNGFFFKMINENIYNIRQWASSRHADPTKRPKLVVIYH